jgi:altronate dehydratase
MKKGLVLDPRDNVGIVIEKVSVGDEVRFSDGAVIKSVSDLAMPHKIALADIEEGATVIKYGEVIGYTTVLVKQGEFVHVHNIDSEKIMK